MKTMQQLILGEISKAIETAGLQAVQQTSWKNIGSVYAMDGIQSRCKITYDFQGKYFGATISPVKVKTSPPLFTVEGDKATWTHVGYEDPVRIASILHELGHALASTPKKRKRK